MISLKFFLYIMLIGVSQFNIVLTHATGDKQDNTAQLEFNWNEKQHYLPEYMRVEGTASGYLPAEQVMIVFDVETLSDSAGTSLVQNNQNISKAISEMKKFGIEEKQLSTQDLRIFPSYKSEYDEKTKNYKQIFEGYKVENRLVFTSKKIELAGKVIDIAVSSGINKVSSVQIAPTQSKIKQLKDSLISEAVDDAIKRANLALGPLKYEIKSVKSINIDDYQNFGGSQHNQFKSQAFIAQSDGSSGSNTQIFESNSKFSVSLSVSFIIGMKDIERTEIKSP